MEVLVLMIGQSQCFWKSSANGVPAPDTDNATLTYVPEDYAVVSTDATRYWVQVQGG